MLRNPEQAKKREEKRKILREFLPVDLQLRFVQKRPEKEKWFFEGELLKRRHSGIYKFDEDELFYEAIKAVDKGIDSEEIKEIQEKIKEKRKEIADNLNDYLDLKQAMQKFFDKGHPDAAGKIAIALNDLESARKAMQECFDQRRPDLAGKIAIALNDLESARKAMQECFDRGWLDLAGKIAIALNDLESARKAMQECFDQDGQIQLIKLLLL
jgi:ribosomal protein L16/L10AE